MLIKHNDGELLIQNIDAIAFAKYTNANSIQHTLEIGFINNGFTSFLEMDNKEAVMDVLKQIQGAPKGETPSTPTYIDGFKAGCEYTLSLKNDD